MSDYNDVDDDNDELGADAGYDPLSDGHEGGSFAAYDCALFAIDVACMTLLRPALQTVAKVMMDQLKSPTQRDRIGVILYNVDGPLSGRNQLSFGHIASYIDLDRPDPNDIMKLQNIVDDQDSFDAFCSTLSPADRGDSAPPLADFSQLIWLTMSSFTEGKATNCTRRLFLLTDVDDPTLFPPKSMQRSQYRSKCQRKLADLVEMEVQISILLISDDNNRTVRPFRLDSFYGPFLEPDEIDADQLRRWSPDDLPGYIRSSVHSRRVLASLMFDLNGGISIAVNLVNPIAAKKGAHQQLPVYLDPSTNEVLQARSQMICTATGATLDDHDVETFVTYAGEDIPLSAKDRRAVSACFSPGIQLIGFKPMSSLADYHNVRSALFIRPDDKRIQGSMKLAFSLCESMNRKSVLAVCRITVRNESAPRLAALIPQCERFDQYGDLVDHLGLHCIMLPYMNDIRQVPVPDVVACNVPSDELIAEAKAICMAYQITDFSCEEFPNPIRERFYAALQALALNQKQVDKTDDVMTMPVPSASAPIFERFAKSIFGDAFQAAMASQDTAAAAGKRPAATSLSNRQKKKDRVVSANGTRETAADVEQFADPDQLSSFTVSELKEYLRKYNLPISGRKADIIDRIVEHVRRQDAN